MKTTAKNWQVLNGVKNMTSLYLYGQIDKPDLLSDSIFRDGTSNNAETPGMNIKIDNMYDFMTSAWRVLHPWSKTYAVSNSS